MKVRLHRLGIEIKINVQSKALAMVSKCIKNKNGDYSLVEY